MLSTKQSAALHDNIKVMLTDLTEAVLIPLWAIYSKDPGLVLTFVDRLLNPSLTLNEFAAFLDKAASSGQGDYALYLLLFNLKKFLTDLEIRKKQLGAIATYSSELDGVVVEFVINLIKDKTPKVILNQADLMEHYIAKELTFENNPAWRQRDNDHDAHVQNRHDAQPLFTTTTHSGSSASTTQRTQPTVTEMNFEIEAQHYYYDPARLHIPSIFNFFVECFARRPSDDTAVNPMPWFYAHVFRQNPDKINDWIIEMSLERYEAREVLAEALWQTNTPKAHQILNDLGKNPLFKKIVKKIKEHIILDLLTCPYDSASMLDRAWSAFHASGNPVILHKLMMKAIGRNFSNLEGDGETITLRNTIELLVVTAAKTSVIQHLKSDPKALEIAQRFVVRLQREAKKEIQLLIDGATGKKSPIATLGMQFFNKNPSNRQKEMTTHELFRITHQKFKGQVREDTVTYWVQLTDEASAQSIVDYLAQQQAATKITVRHTENGHKPLVMIEGADLNILQNIIPMPTHVTQESTASTSTQSATTLK